MKFFEYSLIATAVLTIILMLYFALRGGRPLKTLLLHSLAGILGLAAVNLTSIFTGIHIPINEFSVGTAAVFGLPATIGMLIMELML